MSDTKLCKNCKWYVDNESMFQAAFNDPAIKDHPIRTFAVPPGYGYGYGHMAAPYACTKPAGIDLISGIKISRVESASKTREDKNKCGPEGAWFEPK